MSLDYSAGNESEVENLSTYRLCADIAVIVWDVPGPLRTSNKCKLEIAPLPVPLVSVGIPLETGGQRMFWAMRTSETPVEFTLTAGSLGPNVSDSLFPADELPPCDTDRLLSNLSVEGHIKLITNILTTWRSAFRLSNNQSFIALVRDITLALTPNPRDAQPCGTPVPGHHLIETGVDPLIGDISAIYGITSSSIIVIPPRFKLGNQRGQKSWQPCHFFLEAPQDLPSSLLLVLSGAKGIAVRKLGEKPNGDHSFAKWWSKWHGNGELREFLVRELHKLGPTGSAVAVDLQTRAPLPIQKIKQSTVYPAAEIDLALALDGGLIAGGWLHDPSGMIDDLLYLPEGRNAVSLKPNFHRFPGKIAKSAEGTNDNVTGFVAWLPDAKDLGPLLQPRFQLRLTSGTQVSLTPGLQPFASPAQRKHILRAIPPQHAHPHVFETILAPALSEVEAKLGKSVKIADTKEFGKTPKAPLVSIVIPLYYNLDFLRFQFSAMATDPWLVKNAELIFVLDSPDIADDTEHMLEGLHILHDLPFKLAIMNRNGGYARACNAGASIATGTTIVMLNSDVVPAEKGWLQQLTQPLFDQPKLGAIGPRLLFEDGSLQHAGLYFARDRRGVWLNHHYYKGMPTNYAPALIGREVPAVTGACLVTRKDIFDLVGGFTDNYIIGDYEDSDICLKIRQLGFQIYYEPSVALYHFERRSIKRSVDYMRGVASQYNSWFHTQRWEEDIAELMSNPHDHTPDDRSSNVVAVKTERSAA